MQLSSIVTISIYAITILFVLIGFLFGLWKGFKKASLRLVVFLAFLVLAALLSQVITKGIINIAVSINGTTAPISQHLLDLLLQNQTLASFYQSSSAFAQLINAVPLAIANFVVFMVLIYVIGLLGWIVYLILATIFIKKPKKPYVVKDGKAEISIEYQKPKQHRLLGGVVGAVQAFILLFVTLMPITAIASTFTDLTNSTTTNVSYAVAEDFDEYTPTSKKLREVLPAQIFETLNAYNSTLFAKISSIGDFDKLCFDTLTTVKVNEEKITLRKEINNIAKVYDNIDFLMTIDFANANLKTLNYDKIEKALDSLFDSGLLKSLLPDVLNFVLEDALSMDSQLGIVVPAEYTRFVQVVKDELALNSGIKAIKTDVYALFGITKSLAQSGIIDEIKSGNANVDNILTIATADNRLIVNNVVNNLFSSNIVKALLVEGLNYGLETINEYDSEVEIPSIDKTKINWSAVSSNFTAVLNASFDLYSNFSECVDAEIEDIAEKPQLLLNLDEDLLTEKLALIMTKIQNSSILVSNNEDKIYDKLIDLFMNTQYSKFIDMSVFKEQNSWNRELQYLNSSLKNIKESGIVLALCEDTIDYELILDKLAIKNQADNNTYIKNIIYPLLNSKAFEKTITNAGFGYLDTIIEKYQNELGKDVVLGKIQGNKLTLENEKELVVAFFENIVVYAQDLDLDELSRDAFKSIIESNLTRLGSALDTIKDSQLFGKYQEKDIENPGIYINLIDALANNPSFNKFADFEASKENDFSWNNELSLIQDAITVLNSISINVNGINKSVLTAIKDGDDLTLIFENLSTDNNDIDNIVNPLCESKLMKKNLFVILNTLNKKLSEILNVHIDNVPETANINAEKQIVIDVLKNIVDMYSSMKDGMTDDVLKNNVEEIGGLLNTLMVSKNNEGIFAGTYDAFLSYLTSSTYGSKVSYLLNEYQNPEDVDWKQILALAVEVMDYNGGEINNSLKTKLSGLVGTIYADDTCAAIMSSIVDIANDVLNINSAVSGDNATTIMINSLTKLEQYNNDYKKVHTVITFIENMTGITELSELKNIQNFTEEKTVLLTVKEKLEIIEGTPSIDDVTGLIDTLVESEFIVNILEEKAVSIQIDETFKTNVAEYIDNNIVDTTIATKLKTILALF